MLLTDYDGKGVVGARRQDEVASRSVNVTVWQLLRDSICGIDALFSGSGRTVVKVASVRAEVDSRPVC
jgi:hypothetical protein